MKRIIIIAIAVLAAAAVGLFYWYQTTQAAVGSLDVYSGQAQVQRENQTVDGNSGFSVKSSDIIKVGPNSRVAIVLKDGSVIRLEAGTEIEVKQIVYQNKKLKQADIAIKEGRVWSHVEPLDGGSEFSVETPTVVATVRGTGFNFDYRKNSSWVFVSAGNVWAALLSSRTEQKEVRPAEIFTIRDQAQQEDFQAGPRLATAEFFDDWIKFNLEQDAKLGEVMTYEIPQPIQLEPASSSTTSTKTVPPPQPTVKKPTPQPAPAPKPEPQPAPIQPAYSSLTLRSNKLTLTTGESAFLKVYGKKPDGTLAEIPFSQIQWNQNPELGIIQSPGYYSGQLVGTAKITAKVGDLISNELNIEIQKQAVKKMTGFGISFVKNQSKTTTYYQLPTAQFTATAYYSDNSSQDVTSQTKWSVTGSAEGVISSSGFYQPGNQGTDTVYAEYNGFGDSAVISIP